MKQILQNLKTGETILEDVPCPLARRGHLSIRTSTSLVSAGTERMLVEFGKASLIEKARQQPDKVRMVLDKIKTDGLAPTIDAVRNKLEQPLPMGYCNVGIVMEIGEGVTGFTVGDRVMSNGKHAEVVCVPTNLCAKIPATVDDESAAFTVLGSIALQGIRLAQPTLGESMVVTGLGLIGLLAVQLLRAHGCRVLGIDFDPHKLELARKFGAETVDLSRGDDPIAAAMAFSRGRGVDGVLLTASTKSSEPVHQAAMMCRKRGRIVLIGVTGLELSRSDFYEKEITFQVSCSYGPGRYDSSYEERGNDYPLGYVRWTEQRNFEAILDMLSEGKLDVKSLISHRFSLQQAEDAYRVVGGNEASLGILLKYSSTAEIPNSNLTNRKISFKRPRPTLKQSSNGTVIGFIGAGNYASQVLIPAFVKTSAKLKSVASNAGISGVHVGKKYGFEETSTDSRSILSDPDINTIVIATRHDSHAHYVCQALKAGKHVFVEKPLALNREQLNEIEMVYTDVQNESAAPLLMVGFNRRFATQIKKIKSLLTSIVEPKSFIMTINAGAIPTTHWIQDKSVGGGRIIGEGCHFIDLLRFLAGSPIVSLQAMMIGKAPGISICEDKLSLSMQFSDGSFGTVHYLANGNKSFPKERLEIFCAGRILQLDNFRNLRGYGWPGFKKMKLWKQDKGNSACAEAFVLAIQNREPSPIAFDELVEVTRTTFDIMDQLK